MHGAPLQRTQRKEHGFSSGAKVASFLFGRVNDEAGPGRSWLDPFQWLRAWMGQSPLIGHLLWMGSVKAWNMWAIHSGSSTLNFLISEFKKGPVAIIFRPNLANFTCFFLSEFFPPFAFNLL